MGGRIKNLHRSGQERRDVWYKKKKKNKKNIHVLDSETGAADRKKSDSLEWEMFFMARHRTTTIGRLVTKYSQEPNGLQPLGGAFPTREFIVRCFQFSFPVCMFPENSVLFPRVLEHTFARLFFSLCEVDSVLGLTPVQLSVFDGHSALCAHLTH